MYSEQIGSAKIQAVSPKPAIELATLIELLAQAIPIQESKSDQPDLRHPNFHPLFDFDRQKRKMRISSSSVLRRLYGLQEFKTVFDPQKNKGFIQDFSLPGFGTKSLIGGNLTANSTVKLTAAVDKLIEAISIALPPEAKNSLSSLLLDQPAQQLQKLAKRTGAYFQNQSQIANLVPIAFPPTGTKTSSQNPPIAKVITASEWIDAEDYFGRLCSSVREYSQNQLNLDEDDIEDAIDAFRAEKERLDSQLHRFIAFLDDQALARVRQAITLGIMQAIARYSQAKPQSKYQALSEYVNRVSILSTTFTEIDYSVDF
jgi:hypothetical protein